jgi:hypothetical protein
VGRHGRRPGYRPAFTPLLRPAVWRIDENPLGGR